MYEHLEQDYILLILNCKKYAYKAKRQRDGWLQTLPSYLPYYHVIGDLNITKEFIFDDDKRILYVRVEDDYLSLPKKVVAAYNAVRETFKFKYIFKTDDDQDLVDVTFFDRTIRLINDSLKGLKYHYGGKVINVDIPYMSKYFLIHPELPQDLIIHKTEYCNGRFYFLSKEAVTNIVSKKDKLDKEYLEDYAVGLHLNPFFKKLILPVDSDKYFIDYIFDEDV
jgi:Galactosyltransferase